MKNDHTRTRNWFLTINKNAQCYNDIDKIIKTQTALFYAYIYHNKDTKKGTHIHVVLKYVNARSFNTIMNTFYGAHIEPVKKEVSAPIQYLIHKNDKQKEQYSINEIITNERDTLESYMEATIETDFNNQTLATRIIENGGMCDLFSASSYFGVAVAQKYQRFIDMWIRAWNYGKMITLDKYGKIKNISMSQLTLLNECSIKTYNNFIKKLKDEKEYKKYSTVIRPLIGNERKEITDINFNN